MGLNKDFKDLVKSAERQGWTVVQGKAGHLKWYPPNGKNWVTSAQTPSDYRAIQNVKAWLRREGWQDPTRQRPKVRPSVVASEPPPPRQRPQESEVGERVPWDLYLHLIWDARPHDHTTTQPQKEKDVAEIQYRLAPEGPPTPESGRPFGGGSNWKELLDELAEVAPGQWVQLEGHYGTGTPTSVKAAGQRYGHPAEAVMRNTRHVEGRKGRVGDLWVRVIAPPVEAVGETPNSNGPAAEFPTSPEDTRLNYPFSS